jgi:glycosyltransferase involved in cell wall biosynthesis
MRTSIVMATRNKAVLLERTLKSIFRQRPDFDYEVVVVDDGSGDETAAVCACFDVRYLRLESERYRNPCFARNAGFRLARGEVVIQQSDEVMHVSPETIDFLTRELRVGEFLIATVYNWNVETAQIRECYSGIDNPRPLFFLGSLWRKDLFAVGGYDEDFREPCYDDDWHAACLTRGLGLRSRFVPVLGLHQAHGRPSLNLTPSRLLYEKKLSQATKGLISFCSSGGPWEERQ